MGLRRADDFGGAMEVGYLPDMFGHVAQMPQILRQAGLDHAVVWRGVPSAIDRSAFWWRAPDGSEVRAEYLPEGYGNGASLPDTGAELVEMVRRFEQTHGELLVGPILWMNGTDHLMPQPQLGRLVAEANAAQDDYVLVVAGLADHVAAGPVEGLPHLGRRAAVGGAGEPAHGCGVQPGRREAGRGPRRAHPRADGRTALGGVPPARSAGPPRSSSGPGDRWCSTRPTTRAVRARSTRSSTPCSAATRRPPPSPTDSSSERWTPSPGHWPSRARSSSTRPPATGPVSSNCTFPTADAPDGTQQLAVTGGTTVIDGLSRRDCVQVVQRALDEYPQLQRAEARVEADDVLHVVIEHDPADRSHRYAGSLKAEVSELAAAAPDGPARVEIVAPPSQRVLARMAVPALGWARWEPRPLDVDPVTAGSGGRGPVGGPAWMDNGLVRVEVDPGDGTLSLVELDGERRRVQGSTVSSTTATKGTPTTGRLPGRRRGRPPHVGVGRGDRARAGAQSHRGAAHLRLPRGGGRRSAGGRGGHRGGHGGRAAGRLTPRADHRRARQSQPRPPTPHVVPAPHQGEHLGGRVRVRGRVPGHGDRGRPHRAAAAHPPVAPLRRRRRPRRRARGPARVRARRPRARGGDATATSPPPAPSP